MAALQQHVLHPAAVEYLVAAVKQHLDALHAAQGETRRRLELELAQVETEAQEH